MFCNYFSSIPAEYRQKDASQSLSGAIKQELVAASIVQTVDNASNMKEALSLPVKREREESTDSENQPCKKVSTAVTDTPTLRGEDGSQDPPIEQDLVEVDMSNSIEILDSELDDIVIDLTQDSNA